MTGTGTLLPLFIVSDDDADDGRICILSFPVPKDDPTAIRDQNSYVAHRNGIMPMMNTMVLARGERPATSTAVADPTPTPTPTTVSVPIPAPAVIVLDNVCNSVEGFEIEAEADVDTVFIVDSIDVIPISIGASANSKVIRFGIENDLVGVVNASTSTSTEVSVTIRIINIGRSIIDLVDFVRDTGFV